MGPGHWLQSLRHRDRRQQLGETYTEPCPSWHTPMQPAGYHRLDCHHHPLKRTACLDGLQQWQHRQRKQLCHSTGKCCRRLYPHRNQSRQRLLLLCLCDRRTTCYPARRCHSTPHAQLHPIHPCTERHQLLQWPGYCLYLDNCKR